MIRKILFLILCLSAVWAQNATDLFISEYVEGSGYNKYIEIFNGTGNTVDLSQYKLKLYSNGATTTSKVIQFSGNLQNNSVVVVKHPSATLYSGSAIENSEVINFNGDDAIALIKNESFIDIFGSIGERPTDNWISGNIVTKDKTLKRKSSVKKGVSNSSTTGFPTLGTEWEMVDKDTHDLGRHDFEGGVTVTAPTAISATDILDDRFTANWTSVIGAVTYYLDISEMSDFSTFVEGYENKDVSNVITYGVFGMKSGTTYYFRVRVKTSDGTSPNSNVISFKTTGEAQTTLSFGSLNQLILEDSGQYQFGVEISNPSSTEATSFDIVLTKGDAAQMNNFTTIHHTFEPNSATTLMFPIVPTSDDVAESLNYFTFEIKNVSGGTNAVIGEYGKLNITLVDDDQDKNPIYNGLEIYVEQELKTELYFLIKGHQEFEYTNGSPNTWDILKESDQDPDDTTKVHLIYTGFTIDKDAHSLKLWNREHVWAKSHGDFGTEIGPGTDAHHLRPAHPTVNSARNNFDFDNGGSPHSIATECKIIDDVSWEPRDEMKGDVARMIFYMAVRYEGENGEPNLEVIEGVNTSPNKEPFHGNLSTLIEWNNQDPPSAFEMRRNEIIYKYQKTRNPFIDNYNYANLIWNLVGIDELEEVPESYSLSQNYPNPFNPSTTIKFSIIEAGKVKVVVYNVLGQKVKTLVNEELEAGTYVYDFNANELPSGVYFYSMKVNNYNETKKMLLIK